MEGMLTTVSVSLRSTRVKLVDSTGRRIRALRYRPKFSAAVALAWMKSRWLVTDIVEFP
jgi:hypothetical protein